MRCWSEFAIGPGNHVRRYGYVGVCCALLSGLMCGCGQDAAVENGASNEVTDPGGSASLFGDSEADSEESAAASGGAIKTGDVITNSLGMKLGVVPPGEFQMGSPDIEEKRSGDEARHVVRLSKPIFIGVYEVTQAEFQLVMETNPSGITDSDRLPVQNISWEQAVAFCRRLSELPAEKAAGRTYRLPTEAEWEYACRAGSTTPSAFGASITSSQANFDGNYPYGETTEGSFVGKPQAVGSYEPNAWGLYDMHGNVWEWCSDWYGADYYTMSASEDPSGPESGISHVIRGGSWYNFGYVLRSAYRSEFTPPLEANIYGFRVVAAFGPDDAFEPSELDNPNPTPVMSAPSTPTVASSTSKPATSDIAASSTSSSMAPGMSELDLESATTVESSADSTATTSSAASAETQNGPSTERHAVQPISTAQFLLLPFSMIMLLSLVDATRLNQGRHYDIAALLLIGLALVLPAGTVRLSVLGLLTVALAVRLVYLQQQGALPKAVVPRSGESGLLVLAVTACAGSVLLQLAAGSDSAALALLSSAASRVLVGAALVAIGQRWKNRTLGLSLALVWLVLPVNDVPLAAAFAMWGFVLVNRAPLAGVLFGAAIATHWWLACLVPLWVSYYRGKARARFLTTTLTCGLVGIVILTFLPTMLRSGDSSSALASMSVGELVTDSVSAIILCGVAGVAWFWPVTRSESTVTLMSTLLVMCMFLCSRSEASLVIALPWLLLSLTGGCASRGPLIVADGVIVPHIRRFVAQFHVRAADSKVR